MTLALYRIDDRLIHGQVVVGWGQPLNVSFIVLVDDEVRSSDWEQDLYRMGVPPSIEVRFASVEEAAQALPAWEADPRVGILLVADIDTAVALAERAPQVRRLNIGGVHHRTGRTERVAVTVPRRRGTIIVRVKRNNPTLRSVRLQSNQEMSLSWQ